MLENQGKKKLNFHVLAVLLLAFCLVLPMAATVVLTQPSDQDPTAPAQPDQISNTDLVPNLPASVNEMDNNSTMDAPKATPDSSNQSVLLTKNEALKIAMPLIEKYASENGRVISSVNATFCTAFDTEGIFHGVASVESSTNPADIIKAFQNATGYPAWSVDAFFAPPAEVGVDEEECYGD
jgi:hypothetical protein